MLIYPKKGKKLDYKINASNYTVMNNLISLQEFTSYILDSFQLTEQEFDRLMDEFLAFFELEVEEFIRQRHLQLKKEGLKNEAIYEQINQELDSRRFKSADLSQRQIRRIIYG